MRSLVDSDWLIDALADIPSAREPLERLAPQGLAVSIVAVGELYEGAHGFPDPEAQLTAYRAFLAPSRSWASPTRSWSASPASGRACAELGCSSRTWTS